MDHSDLIAELPRIEKLTAAERLKIAKERRINQLLRHEQYERELSTKRENKILSQVQRKRIVKARSLRFVHSVMLLEAAARNDIEEGKEIFSFKIFINFKRSCYNYFLMN
jgi:protein phosphatase 1 regulatory subunit 16A